MGTIYRPKYEAADGTIRKSAVWWLRFRQNGKRVRQSARTTDEQAARALLAQREEAAQASKPAPAPRVLPAKTEARRAAPPAARPMAPEPGPPLCKTHRLYLRQFRAWQSSHPTLPLGEQLVGFIQGRSSVGQSKNVYFGLKRVYWDDSRVDWAAMPFPWGAVALRRRAAIGKPTRYGAYAKVWARFDRFVAAHPELPDLPAQIAAFLQALTPSCASAAYFALRARYDQDDDGPPIKWRRLPRVRYNRDESRLRSTVLSADDRARLEQADLTVRERAVLALLYHVRRAEAGVLRWRNIDFGARLIYVPKGKGGRTRWVGLHPRNAAALLAWRDASAPEDSEAYVFPSPKLDAPLDPDSIGRWVAEALTKAGIKSPYRGAHSLRRTLATEYLRVNRRDLEGLKKQLGHARLATTELYLYLEPTDFTESLDRVQL